MNVQIPTPSWMPGTVRKIGDGKDIDLYVYVVRVTTRTVVDVVHDIGQDPRFNLGNVPQVVRVETIVQRGHFFGHPKRPGTPWAVSDTAWLSEEVEWDEPLVLSEAP